MTSVKTNVTELPESRVRVEAEVPAEEVERRVEQTARALGRQLKIPGFRKGKVPAQVVVRRIGREAVLDETVRGALGSWYVDAIDAAGGEPVEGGEARDELIEVGGGRLADELEAALRGMKAGETTTVEVPFPDDHRSEQLRGRTALFEVTVKEVKRKELPELDDDFAADAAGFDSLQELRADVRQKLEEAERSAIEDEFRRAVVDAAAAEAQVDVPPTLVEARARELWEQMAHALGHQGIAKEAYLQISGKTEEELIEDAKPDAEQALRREAVLTAVAEAEGIEPSEEDLLGAVAPAAEREGLAPQKLLDRLRQRNRLEPLRRDLAAR